MVLFSLVNTYPSIFYRHFYLLSFNRAYPLFNMHATPPLPLPRRRGLNFHLHVICPSLFYLGVASFLLPLIVCKSDPHIVAMRILPRISPGFNFGMETSSWIKHGSAWLPRKTSRWAVSLVWDMAAVAQCNSRCKDCRTCKLWNNIIEISCVEQKV